MTYASQRARNGLGWNSCVFAALVGCVGCLSCFGCSKQTQAPGEPTANPTDFTTAEQAQHTTAGARATNTEPSNAMPPREAGVGRPLFSRSASRLSASAPEATPALSAPELLGTLAGVGSPSAADVRVFGTDLGLSFEHQGRLYMLFGDTWYEPDTICKQGLPPQDDTVATLPLEWNGTVPKLEFITRADDVSFPRNIQVYRDGEPLKLGYGQAPMSGWSDGERSFALFERLEPVHCGDTPESPESLECASHKASYCSQRTGLCLPNIISFPVPCDLTAPTSCFPGQTCEPTPLCVDPTSSQYSDDSFEAESSSVRQQTEIGLARADSPADYDSVLSWHTNKFSHPTTRTVRKFTAANSGNDYQPGHDTLFVWGRPGFIAEQGRQAALYLAAHPLPLPLSPAGKLTFQPRYFAGIDPTTHEPQWSSEEADARPLALDGSAGGDSYEEDSFIGPFGVSYLPPPVDRWMMLYGGDLADYLMIDPIGSRGATAPGSIRARFAKHPWGPWSEPIVHLAPGREWQTGAPYGPGGFLYSPACVDVDGQRCMKSDPHRPLDTALEGCPIKFEDPGRMYAPNIIDNYTRPNAAGGLDVIWNVSTWNPYSVLLFKTSVAPSAAPPPLDELADRASLIRLADLSELPHLPQEHGRYVQQTSRDRGTSDYTFPLSNYGNRDFNNFVCASADATLGGAQFAPFAFDLPSCPEDYVHGAVLARFEGAGQMVRMWLGMQSLLFDHADAEVLRIYVDDEPTPRVDVPLRAALDGSAGEVFAPPFGAGSPYRLAWYYPVAFKHKLIVALDKLGDYDNYFYHCDAVLTDTPTPEPLERSRLPERTAASRQLNMGYHRESDRTELQPAQQVQLDARGSHSIELDGPATLYELRVRYAAQDAALMSDVHLRVRWDNAEAPAIDLPLLALFAATPYPPELSNQILASYQDGADQLLALKLPAPFAQRAVFSFENTGGQPVAFTWRMLGERALHDSVGRLHAEHQRTRPPPRRASHVAIDTRTHPGRGRLVGICGNWQGHADANAGIQTDPLNLLEGDVRARVDGALALDGTGTEEYADDVFYYVDAPHARPFEQAWGVLSDSTTSRGQASFCRWHVLGNEIDFTNSLELSFELGGANNPQIVDQVTTVAYYYQ